MHTRVLSRVLLSRASAVCAQELKTWDHACALICVSESGGTATDALGAPVTFPGRSFRVAGGVVCASRFASDEVKQALLEAAKPQPATGE